MFGVGIAAQEHALGISLKDLTYLCLAEENSGELGGDTSSVYEGCPYVLAGNRVTTGFGDG